MRNKLVTLLTTAFALMLAYSSVTFAEIPDVQYFLDHTPIKPKMSLTVDYAFPSPEHVIECHQDVMASELGSILWHYKGKPFIGQIGANRSLKLMRADSSRANIGITQNQTAEPTGKLVFTNLDPKFELYVTCSYDRE